MKRLIICLLLGILLSMTSCANKKVTNTENEQALESTAPTPRTGITETTSIPTVETQENEDTKTPAKEAPKETPAIFQENKNPGDGQNTNQIQTPPNQPNGVQSQVQKVKLSIEDPKGMGTIYSQTDVNIEDEDTVYSVLARILKENNTQFSKSGSGKKIYIESINNLYEFDRGSKSGWVYRVNGEAPGKSCSDYTIKSGDIIEWIYSEDLGNDV